MAHMVDARAVVTPQGVVLGAEILIDGDAVYMLSLPDDAVRALDRVEPPQKREHTRSTGAGHTQEAGSAHYRKMRIQPIEYIEANELDFHQGNVVKYVTRFRDVDGLKDLEKAEWYIQRLIENEKKRIEAESSNSMQQAGAVSVEEARRIVHRP